MYGLGVVEFLFHNDLKHYIYGDENEVCGLSINEQKADIFVFFTIHEPFK